MSESRIGRILAKALFIDLDYRKDEAELTNSGALSTTSVNTFVEKEPTVGEWLQKFKPTAEGTKNYFISLFPFWTWIFHYNLTWLTGDVIAGMFELNCNCASTITNNA